MKRLWVAAALAPLSFAASAHAQTVTNSSNLTAPVTTTSTNPNYINNGSIVPTTGGAATAPVAALTMTAAGNVTNAGTIAFTLGVNNTIGILAPGNVGAGNASIILNTGAINLLETTTGDSTAQGITNGPFANGGNRVGIEVNGPGIFNGSVQNTGSITIIGENSAAIAIDTGMSGDLDEEGTISIVGGTPTYPGNATFGNITGNSGNVSYGVHAIGPIGGNVTIVGTVTVNGQNATGVALGDVNGASGVTISGGITASGYRSTTPSTDPGVLALMTEDQLLQSGAALDLGGNIAAGVSITALVASTANTTGTTLGALEVEGSAPALLIGGANAITIGTNASGSSLVIGGTVTGIGTYGDVGATGIQIGGFNPLAVTSYGTGAGDAFANVSMAGGIDVIGEVQANGISKNAQGGGGDITAIIVGSGASLGDANHTGIVNAGIIFSTVTSDSLVDSATFETSVEGGKTVPVTASAITVQSGANVNSINNSGTISATITGIAAGVNFNAQGGTQGQAIAINDQSGSLTSVTNTGLINASITPVLEGGTADPAHSATIAMYLANTVGSVTVTQNANANTTIIPTIEGDVIFGNATIAATSASSITGSENLDLEAGAMVGNVAFLGGGVNSLTINNGATLFGGLTQSDSGDLNINVKDGTLYISAPTSDTTAGHAAGGNTSTIHGQTFDIGSKGQIIFTIDPTSPNATAPDFTISGNATLAAGAKIGAGFTSKLTVASQTYTLVTAGSLTAPSITSTLVGALPYLYAGSITVTATDLDLTVSQKTAAQLGFNPAQGAALSAIYSQMSTDPAVESDVLSQTTRGGFLHIYNQFLPDYAGGPFESLATAQRAIADAEAEAPIKLQSDQTRGWVQEIGYLGNRDESSKTNSYQSSGFGLVGGIERASGDSAVGLTAAFISDGVGNNVSSDGQVSTLAFEGGAYWRAGGEGLQAHASVNGGYVAMGSHRLLLDQTSAGSVTLLRDAESQWSGAIASANFGFGYQITHGRFSLRPEVAADYIGLFESGHSEKGGGPALDLAIASRTSTEASAVADVVMGYTFGQSFRWTPQMTLGYREILTGGPGETTARFISGSQAFTLAPDLSDKGGILARLGVRAAGPFADVTADAGGEFRNGYQTYDARAVARFLF